MVPFGESFWIRVVFFRSFIRIYLFLLSIYSFRERIYRGWEWSFKTRIHICHRRLAFSNSVHFLVLRWGNSDVCTHKGLFRDLEILFLCYISSRLFCDVFFPSPYLLKFFFCFQCIWFLVHLRSFYIYSLVEFSFVIFECPVLSVLLDPDPVSFKLPFFRQSSNLCP